MSPVFSCQLVYYTNVQYRSIALSGSETNSDSSPVSSNTHFSPYMPKADAFKRIFWISLIQVPFILALVFLSQQSATFVQDFMHSYGNPRPEVMGMIQQCCVRLFAAALLLPLPLVVYFYTMYPSLKKLGQWQNILEMLLLCIMYYFVIATRFLQFPLGTDDTFMDYRFVRNWVEFTSFDFNPGERVMGYTSILHCAVLFLLALFTRYTDIPILATTFNAALTSIVFIGLHAICRKMFGNSWQPLIACCVYAVSKYSMVEVGGGKESLMVNCFILLAMFSIQLCRWNSFAWTGTLLFLTRPEGLLWLLASATKSVSVMGSKALRGWDLPLLTVSVVYLFLFLYYGSVIPHGAIGRATMFQAVLVPSDKTVYFILIQLGWETFDGLFMALLGMFDALSQVVEPKPHIIAMRCISSTCQGLLAIWLMGWLGKGYKPIRFYFYGASLVLMFFFCSKPWSFPWYYSWFNLISPFVVALMAGALFKCRLRRATWLLRAFSALLVFHLLFHPLMWGKQLFIWEADKDRLIAYQQVANYIKGRGQVWKTIAVLEPGVIGYYLPNRFKIIDLGGLQSPEALQFFPIPESDYARRTLWCAVPVNSILELKPDCFVVLDSLIDNGLTKNDNFMREYSLNRHWIVTPSTFDARAVLLFERRSQNRDANAKQ
ncbi:MAG: hypothetical protein K2X93_07710 [Candidatus Obscuribacterales bacterium]|nr:hypothetical protein [Candidatus Obscuribacterales bacterium]